LYHRKDMSTSKSNLFQNVEDLIKTLRPNTISHSRKDKLQPLIDYIQSKVSAQQEVRLNFICTHNSRRSHLSQVWAQTLASHYGISKVFCYSGGTEVTALFPMAIETLENSGFEIKTISKGSNSVYEIKYAANAHPVIGFSKTYDDSFNPTSKFTAILTCSSADVNCPIIAGAEKRIPLMYEDPKAFDHTPQQAEKYHERSLQIATEMCYVFSKVESQS